MNNRITSILITVWLFTLVVSPALAVEAISARQVLVEMNLARTEPHKYAGFLRELRKHFQGKFYRIPGTDTIVRTKEGRAAVDEAISYLVKSKPLPPLKWSAGLAAAARDLSSEQSISGSTGHVGRQSGGMRMRINRHGIREKAFGEDIAYGSESARGMVIALIIDDGVANRGHRKNLFNSDFVNAGVSCTLHPSFGNMCVIDFSSGFMK